jgi:hypothetical protein
MLFGLKKPLKREAGWIGIITHTRIPTPPIFPSPYQQDGNTENDSGKDYRQAEGDAE